MYMNRKISLSIVAIVLAAVLFIVACNKSGSKPATNTTKVAVSIENFSFVSSALTITKGTTVVWTNNDVAPHTVTADDNSFTSSTLNKGDTFSHVFTAAGTLNYHCAIHSMMKASVVVN